MALEQIGLAAARDAAELGVRGPRAACGCRHAGASQFTRQGLGEAEHESLAGIVGRHERSGHEAGHRGDVEDASLLALQHARQEQVGQLDQGSHVDVDHFELGPDVQLCEGSAPAEPGVVDQKIEGAARGLHLVGDEPSGRGRRQIGCDDRAGGSVRGRQFTRQLIEALAPASH